MNNSRPIYPSPVSDYEANLSEEENWTPLAPRTLFTRRDMFIGSYSPPLSARYDNCFLTYLTFRSDSVESNPFSETASTLNFQEVLPPTRTFSRRIRPSSVLALNSDANPLNSTLQQTGTPFGTPLEREIFSRSPLESGSDRTSLLNAYVAFDIFLLTTIY